MILVNRSDRDSADNSSACTISSLELFLNGSLVIRNISSTESTKNTSKAEIARMKISSLKYLMSWFFNRCLSAKMELEIK